MTPTPSVSDQAQRDRIESELDKSFFVEAGAGTGKTTSLVARVVALVRSGVKVEGVAAITFTEAAAAELRERIRLKLEEARGQERSEGERRCAQALRDLHVAAIQTLHSFAGGLLRERPLEAGLPPIIEVSDEIEADVAFDRRWDTWLRQELESPSGAALARAVKLGLKLDSLRQVAKEFHENYDLLSGAFSTKPVPTCTAPRRLVEAKLNLSLLLKLARNTDDRLLAHTEWVVALASRMENAGWDSERALEMLASAGKLSTNLGAAKDWDRDKASGKNGCTALKDLLKRLEVLRSEELAALRGALVLPVLESLRGFVIGYAEERKREGQAEFHDLLFWARDLLRVSPEAREHFQMKFTHILIDESQDTDPIQAEIAFFLSGNPGDPVSRTTEDWRQVVVVPGKLFVVGDPKQSIYRFRRADIAVMEEVRGRLEETLELALNHRSQANILTWVNHVFGQWMAEGSPPLQARYIPLEPKPGMAPVTPAHGVTRIGRPIEGSADDIRKAESRELAGLVKAVRAGQWRVRDEEREGEVRPASYRDVCVLIPTRTGLRGLEHALDDANLPYRVESQSLVLNTQDVRELLACLRAIDSPADQVAVVAALRSSAFACSDVDLLQFVEAGGRFDYFSPGGATGLVRDALDALLGYHRLRTWVHPDELIERFIRERRMVEASFGRQRPRERWRRLRLVVERARAYAQAEGSTLRGFLDWMERQAEEGARMVEVPVPETDEDAVRIMTIHAAKGLQFPIVVLAGIGARPVSWTRQVIFDRSTGAVEVRVGGEDAKFATSGYEDAQAKEKEAQTAEAVRLMYVAATRARDHLVVSLYHQDGNGSHAARIMRACESRRGLWALAPPSLMGLDLDSPTNATRLPTAEEVQRQREDWLRRRAETVRKASVKAALAATELARVDKEEAERGEAPHRRGRGGTNVGRAVHGVLQTIDLDTGAGLDETARAQAAAEGIPDRWPDVARLSRTALGMEPVRRAVASGRYYREVFVGAPVDGALLEGFIDLLFEEDGGLVIVDYKTDAVEASEVEDAKHRYEVQAGVYALAAQRNTGKPVREALLLFLEPALAAPFPDVDALITKARERVKEAKPQSLPWPPSAPQPPKARAHLEKEET